MSALLSQVFPFGNPRFSCDDAIAASKEWGFNCGPAALAVVANMTPAELRLHMGDFERKGHTNPSLMFECLNRLKLEWRAQKVLGPTGWHSDGLDLWPNFGLVRVQWEGPWTALGVPIRVRYRHTHWIVAARLPCEEPSIFDINCLSVGGWVPLSEWRDLVVPWILRECEPKANGGWHLTHILEVQR